MTPKSPGIPPKFWRNWKRKKRMDKPVAKKRMRFYVIGFYMLLFGLWQLAISLHCAPDYLFPSPYQVFKRLFELIHDGLLLPSIEATIYRMAIGFSIAGAIGLVIGMLMGMSSIANACLKSLFLGLQT